MKLLDFAEALCTAESYRMILVLPGVSHVPGDQLPGQLPGVGVEVSSQDHQVNVSGEAPGEKVCQL